MDRFIRICEFLRAVAFVGRSLSKVRESRKQQFGEHLRLPAVFLRFYVDEPVSRQDLKMAFSPVR
jgi:hypothetical protein